MALKFTDLKAVLEARSARWRAAESAIAQAQPNVKRRRLGFVPSPNALSLKNLEDLSRAHHSASKMALMAAPALYPQSFDWRSSSGTNYVTPVKDQGQCGSCCAFGSIAAIEATYQIANNTPNSGIDLSEAQLFFCYGTAAGRCCGCQQENNGGWWPNDALTATMSGIGTEASYPYPAEANCTDYDCTGLSADWQNSALTITGFHPLNSLNDMKTWLSTRGPLVTTMSVYADFQHYSSGVYHYTTGDLDGGHCIAVVGYDEAQECWICKNSWGPGFGDQGFFLIGYGECGIDATMYAVEGVTSLNS